METKEQRRARYAANPEKQRKAALAYYYAHKAEVLAKTKARRQAKKNASNITTTSV
jgi:hypothetical protein